jgi:hypothetical protein
VTEVIKASAGRPRKYNDELQAKADNYIYVYNLPLDQGGCAEAIPSAAGLACYLGVSKSSLYGWAKDFPAMQETIDNLGTKQEQTALNGGIAGVFNSTITRLVLNNYGYSEKQEVTHKVTDDGSNQW